MKNQTINFFGWILFTVSALGFCVASIGSFWSMFGSCFFL
ncbi:MAG TPA: cytochrome oxidase subunit III, partial [Gammaproteobacteria bacterium]|nr:cytochrome oxidase subunit III [Gammaproteobacteria bacterium]